MTLKSNSHVDIFWYDVFPFKKTKQWWECEQFTVQSLLSFLNYDNPDTLFIIICCLLFAVSDSFCGLMIRYSQQVGRFSSFS